mmetsp:Transcript_6109/g.25320  ORF Transcript_6109/g.25320 Transcript_6109/m.25320 type:complete len:266 (-) Transcript_6109:163-960(-)
MQFSTSSASSDAFAGVRGLFSGSRPSRACLSSTVTMPSTVTSLSSSSSSSSLGSTPVTKRTFASNRASTAHPACASPPRSNPTSAYCSPPRHVSTQYATESACRHSARRSHCVLRPSQHPISITRRARVPSFIQPSWVNTAVRESALCVNQFVVNSLPAGSDWSVSAHPESARTPLAGVGPVLSGGAPSRVRFAGEPAAPDARSSAESARSRRDRRTPGGAGEARPSDTRDGGSRSSSSRGWRPSPADAPFLVSTRGGDAAVPLG